MRDSRAEAERWLRQAENDLAFGRVALQERFFAQACFVAASEAIEAAAQFVSLARRRMNRGGVDPDETPPPPP